MPREIRITTSNDRFERLREEKGGLTWEQFFLVTAVEAAVVAQYTCDHEHIVLDGDPRGDCPSAECGGDFDSIIEGSG